MIGSLQHAGRQQRQPHTEFRVERVAGKLEEIDSLINEKLRAAPSDALHQVSVVTDAATGTWHAFLTLSRTG
jgi:hypothetical protein